MNSLNGNGNKVSQTCFPKYVYSTVEIYVDSIESWCLEVDITKSLPDTISVILVLIHEVRHILGILLSNDVTSIHFPYYKYDKTDLGKDDISSVQNFYRYCTSTTSICFISTTPFLHTTETTVPFLVGLDLCYLNNLKTYLVINQQLYILREKNSTYTSILFINSIINT